LKKIRIAALQTATTKSSNEKLLTGHNLAWTIEQIVKLAEYGVDLVCLPEAFIFGGLDVFPPDKSQPVNGRTLTEICNVAVQKNVAVICPIIEEDHGKCFNTAFVIDRDGSIMGKYRKIHLTEFELNDGIVCGNAEPTIIQWQGIKIGIQVCFDANWPQEWLNLKKAGADIIFFCSAFSAGKLLESYASLLRIPIVAATWCPHCRIYDRMGKIVAHQSPYYPYAVADIQIKQPLFHLDFQKDIIEAIRCDCPDIAIDIHNGEGTWTLSCDNNNIQSIINKYKLVDVDDYLVRAEKAQNKQKQRN
jgi:predicted amidohydrolase